MFFLDIQTIFVIGVEKIQTFTEPEMWKSVTKITILMKETKYPLTYINTVDSRSNRF